MGGPIVTLAWCQNDQISIPETWLFGSPDCIARDPSGL